MSKKTTDRMSDLEFAQDPDVWPRWPFLPLKRGPQNEESGMLIAMCDKARFPNEPIMPVIVLEAHYMRADKVQSGEPLRKFYEVYPTKEYPTLAAIFADGWVID